MIRSATIVILVTAIGAAPMVLAGSNGQILGSAATPVGGSEYEPESLEFSFGVMSCSVSKLGASVCRSEGSALQFQLPLDDGDEINRLYTVGFDGDLLLIYEFGNVEARAGSVVRLDSRNGAVMWQAWIPGFNVGVPLLTNGSLFVTAIGFVGRIKCGPGRYSWQHDNLYTSYHAFNSFGPPRVDGKDVIFPEVVPSFQKRAPKAVRVDIANGAIRIQDGV